MYEKTTEGPEQRFERIRSHAVDMGNQYLEEIKGQEKVRSR
jgi:hypothetical protein